MDSYVQGLRRDVSIIPTKCQYRTYKRRWEYSEEWRHKARRQLVCALCSILTSAAALILLLMALSLSGTTLAGILLDTEIMFIRLVSVAVF